jgi:DNA polymerase V
MFALIDCNNFFVSCERVFRPDLQTKSVVVLSNNDGCIISRSNESKAAGIPMGAPLFKYKDTLAQTQTTVFSANFSLYGDFSQRVMQVLATFGIIEIYSIDEAFLDLSHVHPTQLTEFGKEIAKTVLQYTGIPVSVGIAKTKTLAKLANEIAKKDHRRTNSFGGVFSFADKADNILDGYLQSANVEDIWGIGYKGAKKLSKMNIFTAKDLKYTSPDWIKANLNLIGLKTLRELNNISCLELTAVADTKKGIASTRSFGKNVTSLDELKEAIAFYLEIASKKLRSQKSVASYLYIFIMTNRFHKLSYEYASIGITLAMATSYTPDLINQAHLLLEKLYKPGVVYKKAGVYLTGLITEGQVQTDIFTSQDSLDLDIQKTQAIKTMDQLQRRFGKSALQIAAQGTKFTWAMNSNFRSPKYTTNWKEIPNIQI